MGQSGGQLHLTPQTAPCERAVVTDTGVCATCLLQFLCLRTVIHHVLAGLTAC